MKPHPETHLPAKSVSLVHLQARVCKFERVNAPKLDKLCAPIIIIPVKFPKIVNPDWGSPRTLNLLPPEADITAFWEKLNPRSISSPFKKSSSLNGQSLAHFLVWVFQTHPTDCASFLGLIVGHLPTIGWLRTSFGSLSLTTTLPTEGILVSDSRLDHV